ncbi:MAG: DNA replication and repair protein RecF [Tannerella sp.]|jgi:DNA replication and repair protein RecF|nr:DNA replication and repair protein RecF [Tannerella sp.]
MWLRKISILHYKNIKQADLSFSPKLNCFFGDNGMGKTNLLDAVYYLSFCRSCMNTPDSQLISYREELCLLQGEYERGGRTEEIFCALRRRGRKQFKRNKKEYGRLSEHIGLLPAVMVSPSDAALIAGGSAERRRFLDLVLSQHDAAYLHALIAYNKALLQRNVLLRESSSDEGLFEALEDQLARHGRLVYEKRRRLVEALLPLFARYHRLLCGEAEEVGLSYVSQLSEEGWEERLRDERGRDRLLGFSSVGVHKDELDMRLGDCLMRRAGSQGQNKTFLIALKLAQFAYLKQEGGEAPLLLLDDLFDKLDRGRVERLIGLVASADFGQIFLTDTNRQQLDEILRAVGPEYRLFRLEGGEPSPEEEAAP